MLPPGFHFPKFWPAFHYVLANFIFADLQIIIFARLFHQRIQNPDKKHLKPFLPIIPQPLPKINKNLPLLLLIHTHIQLLFPLFLLLPLQYFPRIGQFRKKKKRTQKEEEKKTPGSSTDQIFPLPPSSFKEPQAQCFQRIWKILGNGRKRKGTEKKK